MYFSGGKAVGVAVTWGVFVRVAVGVGVCRPRVGVIVGVGVSSWLQTKGGPQRLQRVAASMAAMTEGFRPFRGAACNWPGVGGNTVVRCFDKRRLLSGSGVGESSVRLRRSPDSC